MLTWLLSLLTDFEWGGSVAGATPLCIVGRCGVAVGEPGVREALAEALTVVCRWVGHSWGAEAGGGGTR